MSVQHQDIQKTEKVRSYFTNRARLFDAIYEDDGAFARLFNRVFRAPMLTRYVLTFEALGDLRGRRVLDIGCGGGRYAIELARAGAEVTAIDFSPEMIAMARERAHAAGLAHRITLVEGDFLTWSESPRGSFDAAIALGVLDYVADAEAFIERMSEVANSVIASFPRPTAVRMPLRKLRYAMRGCPVYFYRRSAVEQLYEAAGLTELDLRPLGRAGYWAHGRRAQRA